MTPRVSLPVAAVAVLLLAGAGPATAQLGCPRPDRPLSIGPAYLDAVDGGRALGVVGSAGWCRADYDPRRRLPRALYLGVQADGAVPFRRLRLPQNLQGSAWVGVAWALTERAPDTGGDLDGLGPAFLFDYGVLGVGARLQYETGTDFAEQAILGSAELRWVNANWPLAPSLVLSLGAVRPVASELRDSLDAGHDVHGRVGLQAYWLAPLGGAFEVELDGRAFAGFGLDELVADAGLDRGAFLSGTLAWAPGVPAGPVRLDRLFVGYGHGRQPTEWHERRAWTVGVRVGAR